jgi:glycosyltransferase involved in cell wall biosynthesis
LRKIYPDLELRIVGRRQTRFVQDPELAELLETPGLEFLGYISDQELAQAYSDAALFCYPSLEEGFGLPVLEAMSLGTPVITSNVSCLPEISGDCAKLVDPLSEPAIEAAMREILDWSETERAEVVKKGRAWAGKFTWEAAASAYIGVYREFLAKAGACK